MWWGRRGRRRKRHPREKRLPRPWDPPVAGEGRPPAGDTWGVEDPPSWNEIEVREFCARFPSFYVCHERRDFVLLNIISQLLPPVA